MKKLNFRSIIAIRELLLVIITNAITFGSNVYVQSTYTTKHETESLKHESESLKHETLSIIQSLIPSLTSEDNRVVDMALMILKETVPEKYDAIKTIIIDKKVAASKTNTQNREIKLNENSKNGKKQLQEFAQIRPEWNELISKKIISQTEQLDKREFIGILTDYRNRVPGRLKAIATHSMRMVNMNKCFQAYVGSVYLARYLKESSQENKFLGLVKSCNESEGNKIIKFYVGNELDAYLRQGEPNSSKNDQAIFNFVLNGRPE
jgi:hypothetical protein